MLHKDTEMASHLDQIQRLAPKQGKKLKKKQFQTKNLKEMKRFDEIQRSITLFSSVMPQTAALITHKRRWQCHLCTVQ
jgi:hypothetical protein